MSGHTAGTDERAVATVRQAHRRYAEAIDGRSAEAFAAAFTPAGVLVSRKGDVTTGRDALREFARRWIDAHTEF